MGIHASRNRLKPGTAVSPATDSWIPHSKWQDIGSDWLRIGARLQAMRILIRTFVALPGLIGWLSAQHQTPLDPPVTGGTLPYEIHLREVSLAPAPMPTLHSVAAGKWQGLWVLLAGRTAGLHGMTGNNAFDPQFENRSVWVIDPDSRQSWSKTLAEGNPASGLSADAVDSLSSVNSQFHQQGDTLVVVGGYGFKRSAADHKTYDTLTFVDLPGLVGWVKEPAGAETSRAADHIRQIRNAYFQVTGGSLERLHGEYQLVMGQNYDGRYRPQFNGVYTRQVRRFQVVEGPGGWTVPVESMLPTPPQDAYRRRDLNVSTIIEAGDRPGEYRERAVVHSGVFTPTNGVWTVPVVIAPGGVVTMDDPAAPDTLRQGFQVYHCAKVGMYHRATREMHVVTFGGITVLEHQADTGGFTRDDRAPFTNQCGVVVRRDDGSFRQYFLTTRFPLITTPDGKELRFGTNAEFFPAPGTPMMNSKVVDLAAIRGETVIGHVFGGIVADAGNGGNTGASGRVFEVRLRPAGEPPVPVASLAGTSLGLDWPGNANWRYLLETSTDLRDWHESSGPLAGVDGPMSWVGHRDAPTRFYRLLGATVSRDP